MNKRVRRSVITAVLLVVLVWPAVRNRDSHPLSTYPMYARSRGDIVELVVAEGVAADGEVGPLSLAAIAEVDDPLIVASRLRTSVASGRADELCAEIASRSPSAFRSIEITSQQINLVAHVNDEPDAVVSRELHAECDVPGSG